MITYDELHSENHNITELSNILLYLFRERSMCDTDTVCELFHRYTDKVQEHIDLVDRNLYSSLLTHEDHNIQKMARNFMSGSQEIRRIITTYKKDWCPRKKSGELSIADYDKFLQESEELFDLILERIQNETEKLYPMVRELHDEMKQAV